jgi:hypothetical protein
VEFGKHKLYMEALERMSARERSWLKPSKTLDLQEGSGVVEFLRRQAVRTGVVLKARAAEFERDTVVALLTLLWTILLVVAILAWLSSR